MAESKRSDLLKIINGSVKNKTYTFLAFTALVVLILLVGAIRPTILTITKINKEISQKKLLDDQLENKINSLASLGNQYQQFSTSANKLPLIFPTQGNFSLFMSNIDQIAKNHGYSLSSINFSSADQYTLKSKVLVPWSARLTVVGNKANLIALLEDIESMPMYPVVKQVTFANTDGDGSLSFGIELIIFRIDDPKFYE